MKFLVTGSAGLVGRQVVKDLSEYDHTVYSCYHNSMPEHGTPIKLDLFNNDDIINAIDRTKPDAVIHLAAMTGVDACEKDPDEAFQVNAYSSQLLAKEARNRNSFFLYVSTDYVFDGRKGMYQEGDTQNPLGVYGESKAEGEKRIRKTDFDLCIARTSTPFGVHPKKKTFPQFVIENLKQQKQVPALTDQFTSPTYVPNLSRMLIEIATKKITGIFHVAGATRISRYDTACLVAQKAGLDSSLIRPATIEQMKSWVAKRPKDSSLDIAKSSGILDEKPMEIDMAVEYFMKEIHPL